jgi:hypothetical protein
LPAQLAGWGDLPRRETCRRSRRDRPGLRRLDRQQRLQEVLEEARYGPARIDVGDEALLAVKTTKARTVTSAAPARLSTWKIAPPG